MGRFLVLAPLMGCIGGFIVTSAAAQTPEPPSSRADWTLDAVLTAALVQHPLIQAARAQVTAAEGVGLTASTWPNPVATYWVENARFPGHTDAAAARETSAYATLPLEPFFQRSSRTTQASAELIEAQTAVTSAERRVALDAAHAYYRVALAQVSLAAIRENVAAVQRFVDYLRTRVEQGAAPEGELIRAEVERDRVTAEVTLADVELIRARSALSPFLGAAAGVSSAIGVAVPDATALATPLAPFAEFSGHALAARPELLANRARVDAATAAIEVQRSLVMRQLGATFGLKRTAGINAMVGGVSLTLPLFDRNRGEVQRTTGQRLAAEEEARWLARLVAAEVDGAYQAAVRLTAGAASLPSTFVGRAEESQRIAVAAYGEGAASLLQLIDAARTLTDARLTSGRAIVAASESLFELGIVSGYDASSAARLGRGAITAADDSGRRGGVR